MIKLCDIKDCTGCGACFNVCPKNAIKMEADCEGFLYPRIDETKCIECKLCQKSCPVLIPIKKNRQVEKPLAVIAKSEDILVHSSSGGMFSLMSNWILEHGGVVFGAVFDKNYDVFHSKATNKDELKALRGSKYAQSNTLDTFKEVKQYLRKDTYVLYTGTPCQIAGLYSFLGKLATSNKFFTSDLVCHGVPSTKAFHLYLNKLALKTNIKVTDIKDFTFRDTDGWGYVPSFKLVNSSKRIIQPSSSNIYMLLFLSSRLSRNCCYNCMYTTPDRVGDITIADFWGIGSEKPVPFKVTKGCSFVTLNSEKGKYLFNQISEHLRYDEREWSEALAQNHQLRVRSTKPRGRNRVYSFVENHTYDEIYTHYFNNTYLKVRRAIGKVLRILHLR